MNLAHVHLLLNHFPTVGMIIATCVYVAALITRNTGLLRVGLLIFFGIATLAIPTYVSGNAAQSAICEVQDRGDPCKDTKVSKIVIEAHEGAALPAFVVMIFAGSFAWLALWQYRRFSAVPAWNLTVILILSLISLGLMARAAEIGGEIRHPEIRDGAQYSGQQLARAYGEFVQGIQSGSRWVWATLQTLHFLGMTLMFGVAAVIDLRMLGMMRSIPFTALHRFIPWAILGFGVDLLTGMSYFVGAPWQYTTSPVFIWKIAFIVLAGVNVLYFTIFDEAWETGAGDMAPLTARSAAASALVLVVGILYCGHMLAFLGKAF